MKLEVRAKMREKMKIKGWALGIILLGPLFVLGNAQAALLGFDIYLPDITSNATGTLNYNATTDLFTTLATPISITFDGVTLIPITSASYSANFYVDETGSFAGGVAGDDLVITGNIDIDGDSIIDLSGDLIRGEVTNFGWFDTGTNVDVFDFTFDFTGGALSSYYASADFKGGDQMMGLTNFYGNFTQNFQGIKVKHNTAPTPEPATMLLLGSGMSGYALLGRARRKR